ncbi:hypothetical protein ACWERV_02995 [Streptomyces sp. NPDC004031]
MPLFPALGSYPQWAAELRGIGARHTAEALAPAGDEGTFRVLDGIWFRGRGTRWQRLDRPYVAEWRRGRGRAAADFADRVDAALAADPMAVRRVTLYELAVLLQQHAPGERATAAEALGVDPSEATALAASVTAALPAGGLDREAAEGIQGAWERGRLRLATDLAGRLPATGGDPLLRRLLGLVAAARTDAEALRAEGDRLLATGRPAPAAHHYLRAAALVSDDPRPITGLLRAAPPGGALHITPDGDGVRLTWADAEDGSGDTFPWDGIGRGETAPAPAWRPAAGAHRFHVVRYAEGHPEGRVRIGVAADGRGLLDPDPPPGTRVRYAALPVRGSHVAGPPLTGGPLLIAPEPAGVALTVDRTTVSGLWRTPRDAVSVRVTRARTDLRGGAQEGAGPASDTPGSVGATCEVECGSGHFTDDAPGPGTYTYRVSCGYRAPDGTVVASPGVCRTVTVEEWPVAVRRLDVRADGEKAEFSWDTPVRGGVRLLVEPAAAAAAREPGSALDADLPDAPPGTGELPAVVRLAVPPGPAVRVTAVTVLGRRAVAGPSLVVHAPPAVTRLTAERLPDGGADVVFDWPDGVHAVEVRADQGGTRTERRLTRSGYLRDRLRLPLSGAACTVTVRPMADTTADLVLGEGARVVLPPQVLVRYRLLRPGLRPGDRRTLEVQAVPASGDGADGQPDCPDFLLVGRKSLVPLLPDQGLAEVRLSGARLATGELVRVQLHLGDRPRPYLLRGFLLGPHPVAAQLDHPAPDTLVVR